MKGKPEYEITKTRYEVEREKIKEKLDSECLNVVIQIYGMV